MKNKLLKNHNLFLPPIGIVGDDIIMYLNFYGLKKEPFHITPDPEFFYLSPSHKEALAGIIYGIKQKKGFVAIVGDVGVGKTTVLRVYLDSAEKSHLKIVYVFNARLTFEGLLKTILPGTGYHNRIPMIRWKW